MSKYNKKGVLKCVGDKRRTISETRREAKRYDKGIITFSPRLTCVFRISNNRTKFREANVDGKKVKYSQWEY